MMRDIATRWVLPFVDPRRILSVLRLPRFFKDMQAFRRAAPFELVRFADSYPCLLDRTATTPFDPHYLFQGAWLARKLAERQPSHHHDVASSVLTISVVSGFIPTTFLDYRPLPVNIRGLECAAGSIVDLPLADGSIGSLSCLHVIEHIGLGRYGDPIDPLGLKRALTELSRVLKPGGRFYLSTPVGLPRVCFNAHRVSDPQTIIDAMPQLRLLSFALVDDGGNYREASDVSIARTQRYGCGLFEFEKPDYAVVQP